MEKSLKQLCFFLEMHAIITTFAEWIRNIKYIDYVNFMSNVKNKNVLYFAWVY